MGNRLDTDTLVDSGSSSSEDSTIVESDRDNMCEVFGSGEMLWDGSSRKLYVWDQGVKRVFSILIYPRADGSISYRVHQNTSI